MPTVAFGRIVYNNYLSIIPCCAAFGLFSCFCCHTKHTYRLFRHVVVLINGSQHQNTTSIVLQSYSYRTLLPMYRYLLWKAPTYFWGWQPSINVDFIANLQRKSFFETKMSSSILHWCPNPSLNI